jgi:sulfate permease, SulP family
MKSHLRDRIVDKIVCWQAERVWWRESIRADLFAGSTLALFALPQVMAYALLAGIEPRYGLYGFIVASVVGAVFGSSRHLQTGPVNASSIVAASALAAYADRTDFMGLVWLLTLMAGILQVSAGFFRLGNLTQFISRSVLEGFLGAGGLLIAVNQLPNLLGIPSRSSLSILDGLAAVVTNLRGVRLDTLALGLGTIALVVILKRISPKTKTGLPLLPSYLLAILAATIVARWLGLEERGVRVIGDIPQSLPPLSLPLFDGDAARGLFSGAIAVALIGMAEAISIGRSIAMQSGDRIDPDREFVGQGLAKIAAAFFSGMPVSGSLTRTQLLFNAGAVTRWANVFGSGVMLSIVLLFAPLVRYIPVSALAGMLMLIAPNMVNWEHVRITLRATRADAFAMLATFVAALAYPLDTALFIGVGVSLILFLRKTQTPRLRELIYDERAGFAELEDLMERPVPEISIIHVEGDVFFGAADALEQEIQQIAQRSDLQVLILRMKRAYYVDATFVMILLKLYTTLKEQDKLLLVSGVTPEVGLVFRQSGADQVIGVENIYPASPTIFEATRDALNRALEYLNNKMGKEYDLTQDRTYVTGTNLETIEP